MKRKIQFMAMLLIGILLSVNQVWGATETKSYGWETGDDASLWVIDGVTSQTGTGKTGSGYGSINTANTYVQFKNKVKVTSFTFSLKRTSKNSNYNVYIETSTNGTDWTAHDTYNMGDFGNGSYTTKTGNFDGDTEYYVRVHVYNTTAVRNIDDVSITYNVATASTYTVVFKSPLFQIAYS